MIRLVEIRALRINQRLSEETLCFSATVYVDGKKVGEAMNHGHGGNTDVRIPRELVEPLKEYAARYFQEKGTDEDRRLLSPHLCPLCKSGALLDAAGLVAPHDNWDHERCDGAGQPPVPEGKTYQTDVVEYLIDSLVHTAEEQKEKRRIAKIEDKQRADFAAKGFPFMVRIHVNDAITWFAIRDDKPETIAACLGKAKAKYRVITGHEVLPTASAS